MILGDSDGALRGQTAMAYRPPTKLRPMVGFRAEKHLIAAIEAAAAAQADRPSKAEMIRRIVMAGCTSTVTCRSNSKRRRRKRPISGTLGIWRPETEHETARRFRRPDSFAAALNAVGI